MYADEEVPRNPMRVRVQPTHDATKVTVAVELIIKLLFVYFPQIND